MKFLATALTTLSLLPGILTSPIPSTVASALETRDQEAWSIHGFTRTCTTNNICTYDFLILTPPGTYKCEILDRADNTAWHAYYNVPCIGVRPLPFPFLSSLLPLPSLL